MRGGDSSHRVTIGLRVWTMSRAMTGWCLDDQDPRRRLLTQFTFGCGKLAGYLVFQSAP